MSYLDVCLMGLLFTSASCIFLLLVFTVKALTKENFS